MKQDSFAKHDMWVIANITEYGTDKDEYDYRMVLTSKDFYTSTSKFCSKTLSQ